MDVPAGGFSGGIVAIEKVARFGARTAAAVLLKVVVESIVKGELAVPTVGPRSFPSHQSQKGVAMATIRNQRNLNLLVLNQDDAQRNRDDQAVSTPGSFYLPPVSGPVFKQPSRMRGCLHGTTRHPGHATTKSVERSAWSGSRVITGHGAASALSVN